LASWTSASGATSVCGATFSITFGCASADEESADSDSDDRAADVDDFDSVDDSAADDSAVDDSAGVEGGSDDSLRADAELLPPADVSGAGASDADGALDADGGAALVASGADVVGLFVVDVTGGGVLDGGASRCTGGAALGAAVVGARGFGSRGFGATGSGTRVSTGASAGCSTVDATTGGASTGCCGVGTTTGAGATADGMSATVGFSTGASVTATGGSGAIVVVGTTGSSPGLANAGATPPVSAVSEITTPDASTAQTVRLRQIFNGAPIVQPLLTISPPTLVADQWPFRHYPLRHRCEGGFVTPSDGPAAPLPAERACSRPAV
jgi:hypothetical protein